MFLQIFHFLRCEIYHPEIFFTSNVDKNFAGHSLDFFFVQKLALFSINIKALTRIIKTSWWVDKWPSGLTTI